MVQLTYLQIHNSPCTCTDYQARREPQQGPGNYYRGALSVYHNRYCALNDAAFLEIVSRHESAMSCLQFTNYKFCNCTSDCERSNRMSGPIP